MLWDDLDITKGGRDGEDVYGTPKVVEVS